MKRSVVMIAPFNTRSGYGDHARSIYYSIMDREDILSRIDAIRRGVSGKLPNIYFLHGEIEDTDMNHLYNHPKVKAMINLRSAFGLA